MAIGINMVIAIAIAIGAGGGIDARDPIREKEKETAIDHGIAIPIGERSGAQDRGERESGIEIEIEIVIEGGIGDEGGGRVEAEANRGIVIDAVTATERKGGGVMIERGMTMRSGMRTMRK